MLPILTSAFLNVIYLFVKASFHQIISVNCDKFDFDVIKFPFLDGTTPRLRMYISNYMYFLHVRIGNKCKIDMANVTLPRAQTLGARNIKKIKGSEKCRNYSGELMGRLFAV